MFCIAADGLLQPVPGQWEIPCGRLKGVAAAVS